MAIVDIVQWLESIGLTDVLLPFILVFVLVYGVLEKTHLFGLEKGKPKHRINGMVAFVSGFIIVAMVDVVNVINAFAQYFALVILVAVLLCILMAFAGKTPRKNSVLIIGALILLIALLYAMAWMGMMDSDALTSFLTTPIVAIIIFLLIVWGIFRPDKKEPEKKEPEKKAEGKWKHTNREEVEI